jgi:valyl-tRNA synthetase
MLRLLAPYLAFASEEVWSWWQKGSIHRAAWPTKDEVLALSGEDEEAQKASVYLSQALGAIRKAKTEGQVSVGTPVSSVRFVEAAQAVAALRLVERDLKAAARTDVLLLVESDDASAFGASMIPKPVEGPR